MAATDIILGYGVFKIGEAAVGLTRGGGQFTVERSYRTIEADGDKGNVKGRITKDSAKPKLKMSALEITCTNIVDLYPALTVTAGTGVNAVTGNGDVADTDYNDVVTWTGKTKGGKEVKITLQNAINLDNIDWSLVDKGELISQVTYEGCYLETDRETEPWKVEYTI